MRNPEPVQTRGQFWLPENPEEKLPGELYISELGEIRLDLFGMFTNAEWQGGGAIEDMFGHLKDIDRICGFVKEGGSVTLLNCLLTNAQANLFSEHVLESSSFDASIALVGACYGQDEISFHKFNFVVEGLDDWLETDTIKLTVEVEVVDEKIKSFTGGTVDFRRKESPSYSLDDGVEIQFLSSVKSSPHFPSRPLSFFSLSSQPYISLVSEKPRDIDYFINLADKIRKFISLAVDQGVQFQSFTFLDEISGQVMPVRMYFRMRFVRKDEYKSSVLKVLFAHSNVENSLVEMMNRWVEHYEPDKIGHALNLYFAGAWKESSLLNTNLVFLAQAIEVLHRSTFPADRPMDKQHYRTFARRSGSCKL